MKLNADTDRLGLGQNPRVWRAIRLLNTGLVAFFTLGQAQASMSMPGMQTSMVTQLRGLKGQAFDVAWSKAMMDHHAAAVAMARLEVQKGQVGKIKAAAAAVITDQTREIALMKGWLRQWNQPAYTPVVKLTAPAAGMSTDRWFLTEMIPHHQGAVAMSQLAPGHSQNAAVKSLSLQIIAAQTGEIRQYQTWLKTIR